MLFVTDESRGNMGPGGAGSVIIRVHVLSRAAKILWVASLAMGAPHLTTVEIAYRGHICGLRRAKRGGLAPSHIVGADEMVITQLRMRRSPKKPQLSALYREASSILSDVDVVSWAHHCRGYNQMATTAVAVAVDTGKSTYGFNHDSSSLCCSGHDGLHRDVTFWYDLRFVEENTVQPITH